MKKGKTRSHRACRAPAWIASGAFAILSACATPAARVDVAAAQQGFTRMILLGTEFLHVVYLKKAERPASTLHVYLEGDGSPWRRLDEVAPDPTPRRAVMLALMARDPAAAVYLGRPCYFGLARTPPCSPLLWTHERYSERVVQSMAAALSRLVDNPRQEGLVFLGHSGGGTLAMLLAERFEDTRAVVTLGGNLDTDAWTALHGYSPLIGSLNPRFRPALDKRIVQRHYVGSRDTDVPPGLLRRFTATRPEAELVQMSDMEHGCCWEAVWPDILRKLERTLARRNTRSAVRRAMRRQPHPPL